MCGQLTDDLTDIWKDVKTGLLMLDAGRPEAESDALWHWRSMLEVHWGPHASWAIGALTALCFGEFADPTRAR
jgi:hypothetical protein